MWGLGVVVCGSMNLVYRVSEDVGGSVFWLCGNDFGVFGRGEWVLEEYLF